MRSFCALFSICGSVATFLNHFSQDPFDPLRLPQVVRGLVSIGFVFRRIHLYQSPRTGDNLVSRWIGIVSYSVVSHRNKNREVIATLESFRDCLSFPCLTSGIFILSCFNVLITYNSWHLTQFQTFLPCALFFWENLVNCAYLLSHRTLDRL